jgi:hypothetical protein
MANQDEPSGYQEIGESLAQPVAEGLKSLSWAVEFAKLLGYTTADTKAWVSHYKALHRSELDKIERKRERVSRKVKRWQQRSDTLKRSGPLLDR